MARKTPKLNEAEVLANVTRRVEACVSWFNSKVSKENERVLNYYDGALPRRQREGNSSYVSSDVYDSVETMKAQLLETFAGGHNILRFDPTGPDDAVKARVATKYTSHVIFQQNAGYEIFHDVIESGLMARNSVAQVFWQDETAFDEHKFSGMPIAEVEGLAAQEDVEIDADLDAALDMELGPTYSGTWKRKYDKGRVQIEVIPPEEFYIEERVKRREDGTRGRRTPKTIADLRAEGYSSDKLDKLGGDDRSVIDLSPEAIARFQSTDSGFRRSDEETHPDLRTVVIYETYTKLVVDGRSALHRIVHADGVLFEVEEVDEDPFIEFRALRRAHAWFGVNFAAQSIPTQNARTVLTRGILDHTSLTTNPRWLVLNGALANPRELLDGRLGGVVNTKQRDAVAPLQYGNLNPFVFQTMQMLKENKEERTGISSLSQGLNKDAISTQNSQGLVGDLVALSQVRQKVIARNFANGFLVPLYLKVYRTVVENDKQERVMEVAGEFVQISPQEWAAQRSVSLSLHLGYGEQDREAEKLQGAYEKLASDPGLAGFFTPEKRRKLATDTLEAFGIRNHADYLEATNRAQPPGPDPLELKKLEIQDKQAQAMLIQAQASQSKATADAQLSAMKHTLEELKTQIAAMKEGRDADRKDVDVANRVDVAQRETKMAEETPQDRRETFVAPNN